MGTCAAGRTEIEGAVGFMGGTFLKRICTVAWCLTGLAAFALYRGAADVEPDKVYGLMAAEFLPQLLPGLLGLFLAGLLATVMGSCDSFMISASGLVTENLYRPLFPGRPETHYLWVARASGLAVVLVAIGYAFWLSGVIQGLEILWKLNAVMAPAFWLGVLLARRHNFRRVGCHHSYGRNLVGDESWIDCGGYGVFTSHEVYGNRDQQG